MTQKYYLQDSRQYVGNDMLFWRKGRSGYTTNLDEAHEFTLEEALDERDSDIPWLVEQMRALSRPAVDMQRLPYSTKEQRRKLLGVKS
jgi:hypothetical protein